jgi:hypothetical protein
MATDYSVRPEYMQLVDQLTPEGVDMLVARLSPGARAELIQQSQYEEEITQAAFDLLQEYGRRT